MIWVTGFFLKAIYNPSFVPASQADLSASELIIGVNLNGETRAYPIGPLQGGRLELLAMSIVPWGTWLAQHPDTLALEIRDGFNPRIQASCPGTASSSA